MQVLPEKPVALAPAETEGDPEGNFSDIPF